MTSEQHAEDGWLVVFRSDAIHERPHSTGHTVPAILRRQGVDLIKTIESERSTSVAIGFAPLAFGPEMQDSVLVAADAALRFLIERLVVPAGRYERDAVGHSADGEVTLQGQGVRRLVDVLIDLVL